MRTLSIALVTIALVLAGTATAKHHRQAAAEVMRIDEQHGNIDTNATAETLDELDLSTGDSFPVRFGDREVTVYLGETYSDVPRGDWIAFITGGGNLRIARNFEDAASTLGVEAGDTITLFN
ncbi:MAG: SAM hydroxide adenosyltransferase [Gammaproteobacteria bacterium]|nr:SAM hydroxide adenosyltransferase [Gammaproteobacteria bacterium]